MNDEVESVSPPTGWRAIVRRPRGWGWVVPGVLALTGAVFVASALTAHGTDLRAGRRGSLTDLVRAQESQVRAADNQVADLQERVRTLSERDTGDRDLQAATDRADAWAGAAGLTAVTGPGLTVTLDDAPRDQVGLPADVTPDDLVVHQEDVQAVVNALWTGGAEAMTLMDQRVISTSAVRCVGNTLVLQGRVYSPPFRITAIGDPTALNQALEESTGVRTYRQFVDVVGLGYQTEEQKEITLPPYEGSLRLGGPAA
jgi:uncharacterized protein YlxW (UPF0749 family)